MTPKPCPFCGATPKVTAYPNNLGYAVECPSIDCCTFGHTYDLQEWNRRASRSIKPLIPYLFNKVIVYTTTKFKPVEVLECNHCHGQGQQLCNVKHTKDCPIGDYLASR